MTPPLQRPSSASSRTAPASRGRIASKSRRAAISPSRFAAILLIVVIASTLVLHFVCGTPWLGSWLWMINGAALLAFSVDKLHAVRGDRRIPELALHLLTLLGGTPAALLAMSLMRHKTRKVSFRLVTAAIVTVQLIAVAAWIGLRPDSEQPGQAAPVFEQESRSRTG